MDEQIKPVAWRAKTPHGWVVGKTQHSSCDEPLYPQQAIDALRAEVERLQSDTSFATAISSLRREKERAERLAEALRPHIEDLERSAVVLDQYPAMAPTAAEMRKAAAELRAALRSTAARAALKQEKEQ